MSPASGPSKADMEHQEIKKGKEVLIKSMSGIRGVVVRPDNGKWGVEVKDKYGNKIIVRVTDEELIVTKE